MSSSSDTGASEEQSVAFSFWCLHCPPSLLLLPLSSPGCSCICAPGEDYKELLCEGMQLLKSDEIQLKRREQVGQQRHPTVPRISGCRAVPPSSDTPPHPCTHAQSHILGAPPTSPRHTHNQTCVNTSTCKKKRQRLGGGITSAEVRRTRRRSPDGCHAAGFSDVPVGFGSTLTAGELPEC